MRQGHVLQDEDVPMVLVQDLEGPVLHTLNALHLEEGHALEEELVREDERVHVVESDGGLCALTGDTFWKNKNYKP